MNVAKNDPQTITVEFGQTKENSFEKDGEKREWTTQEAYLHCGGRFPHPFSIILQKGEPAYLENQKYTIGHDFFQTEKGKILMAHKPTFIKLPTK